MIGAVAVLPALAYLWGVKPYVVALTDARERLAVERETLAREQRAVATARRNPKLQHIADSAMSAVSPRLFVGRDDVMASAELATYLGDVALKSRVWLQDASTRPAVAATGGVRTLHVDVRAESDLEGILTFLQSLERGDRLVRIDRLDIARLPRASEDEEIETLSISATIAGFAIAGDSAAVPGGQSKSVVATRRDNP
jgi:hypothetical protein